MSQRRSLIKDAKEFANSEDFASSLGSPEHREMLLNLIAATEEMSEQLYKVREELKRKADKTIITKTLF